MTTLDFSKYRKAVGNVDLIQAVGIVIQVVGLIIEARVQGAAVGELCTITTLGKRKREVISEVVGFKDDRVLLMPLGNSDGVGYGSRVVATGKKMAVGVGYELLGRVLDGLGNATDGKGAFVPSDFYPLDKNPPDPTSRPRITKILPTQIKSIDSTLTLGMGQRMGIFAGSGVGKSTLMGMLARGTQADLNVIALIGERGREVNDFIEDSLGEEGLKRSVVVCATSDQPPLIRLKGALVATAIAEYFRDQGKNVLLMMDSVTRFSMAQREVGLAAGEPPTTKGYPPSVFAMLPRLMERAGTSPLGSITALYAVLVEGGDMDEPIADTSRGILDGHILLDRELAAKNHFPCIDIGHSISRLANAVNSEAHTKAAFKVREILARYKEAEDLINIGAYVKGSNPKIDEAIEKIDKVNDFLKQRTAERFPFEETARMLLSVVQ